MMTIRKSPFLLILLLLTSFLSFGQEDEEIADKLPDAIGPSPDVTALAKYIDAPVNYASGIPNIEIPIHTVTEGSLEVPISLNYHAGGVKVTETASSVGLGWSLNAGGVVSRMIKHHPDDMEGNIGYIHNEFYSEADLPGSNLKYYFDNNDTEPDVFFFNFMGHSGKFQYYKDETNPSNSKFFLLSESNIQIDFDTTNKNINKFILTSPDGTKYYFGETIQRTPNDTIRMARESTSTNYHTVSFTSQVIPDPDSGNHVTAWHLLEIESVTGQIIKLHYEGTQSSETSLESQKILIRKDNQCEFKFERNDFHVATTFSIKTHYGQRITSIESSLNQVEFEYDTQDRLDFIGSQKLNAIKIKKSDGAIFKEFLLNYDYFESDAPNQGDPDYFYFSQLGDPEPRLKRLRLQRVTEKSYEGSTSVSLPSYEFEYNETKLPHKFSFAQDLWGYYNGKGTNGSLIPKALYLSKTLSITNNPFQAQQGNGDRSVDPEKAKAGVLTKITYPTGGFTEYNYEVNTTSGILIKDAERRFLYRNRLEEINENFTNGDDKTTDEYFFDFTIDEAVVGNVFFKIIAQGCSTMEPGCFTFKLYNSNNQEINSWKDGENTLEPGEYYLHAKASYLDGNNEVKPFQIKMKWEKDPHPNTINVGGLRVKKIVKDDGEKKVFEKSYDYGRDLTELERQSFTTGVIPNSTSSGIIGWWPQVVYSDYKYEAQPNCEISTILMSSYPQKSMFDYSGSSSVYTHVTEWVHDTDSIGSPPIPDFDT